MWHNTDKAIPEAMAELNRQIFSGHENDGDGVIDLDLGNWLVVLEYGTFRTYGRSQLLNSLSM